MAFTSTPSPFCLKTKTKAKTVSFKAKTKILVLEDTQGQEHLARTTRLYPIVGSM